MDWWETPVSGPSAILWFENLTLPNSVPVFNIPKKLPSNSSFLWISTLFLFQVARLQDFRRLKKELLLDILDAIAEYMQSGQHYDLISFHQQVENIDIKDQKDYR